MNIEVHESVYYPPSGQQNVGKKEPSTFSFTSINEDSQ